MFSAGGVLSSLIVRLSGVRRTRSTWFWAYFHNPLQKPRGNTQHTSVYIPSQKAPCQPPRHSLPSLSPFLSRVTSLDSVFASVPPLRLPSIRLLRLHLLSISPLSEKERACVGAAKKSYLSWRTTFPMIAVAQQQGWLLLFAA